MFYGPERFDDHTREHLHESPKVVTGPLIALAVPSVIIGAMFIEPMLFGDYFGSSIQVNPEHDPLAEIGANYHGVLGFVLHGMMQPPFWLAMSGVVVAWYLYLRRPDIPKRIADSVSVVYRILLDKYGFDRFNDWFFAGGARGAGKMLWKVGDVAVIDGFFVNGSAKFVGWWSQIVRQLQSGYLYHYAFAMILGLLALLAVFVHGWIGLGGKG